MIGFACLYVPTTGSRDPFVYTKLAAATLDKLDSDSAYDKLYGSIVKNLNALDSVLSEVAQLPECLRMYRISSDLLPLYTHPKYGRLYEGYLSHVCKRRLANSGVFARKNGIKLSMHPGQFVCLASDRPEVVESSILELEYHARCASYLGYGSAQYNDFKINIHCSGKLGPDGFKSALTRLSDVSRKLITVENAEIGVGLDEILGSGLHRAVPVVLDIHHHWCKTGEFIKPNDTRVSKVLDSWNTRPTLHYSCSKEEYLPQCGLPDYAKLVSDFKMQSLRAHSDRYPNKCLNAWALSFYSDFDIMCEAKSKNLAQAELYAQMLLSSNSAYSRQK